MEYHPLHPWTKFQLSWTTLAMGLSTWSVSQSKTTILIAKVQTWQKCKIVIMSLKDEKGEIMVRERPPKHNMTLPTFSNLV